jgi:hypothetical protein
MTTTHTEYGDDPSATSSRTSAKYTFTKINWVRTRHEDGSITHTGNRAGWTFTIRSTAATGSWLTGTHADGRRVRQQHASARDAKEAALFAMRPDEAMAWKADRRFSSAVQYAAWDRFTFTHYGTTLRVTDRANGATEDVFDLNFIQARDAAKAKLRAAYGGPVVSPRPEGPAAVAEALTRALAASGIKATPKQLAVVVAMLAADLLPDTDW